MRFYIALLALLCLAAGSASAQSIGLYWDASGANCNGANTPNTAGTMYVLGIRGGAAGAGLTGAEFRIEGFPATWFPSPVANPTSNVALGSLMGAGVNIAFPTCQEGSGNVILLYTVSYFAADAQSNRIVSILKHAAPSNPNFPCPIMVLCDAPVYTKLCVLGSQGIINGLPCTVAVETTSWSAVKGLFH